MEQTWDKWSKLMKPFLSFAKSDTSMLYDRTGVGGMGKVSGTVQSLGFQVHRYNEKPELRRDYRKRRSFELCSPFFCCGCVVWYLQIFRERGKFHQSGIQRSVWTGGRIWVTSPMFKLKDWVLMRCFRGKKIEVKYNMSLRNWGISNMWKKKNNL